MEIINIFDCDNKEFFKDEMKKCDWDAGQWLAYLIEENKTDEVFGKGTYVLLLTDNDKLLSFCTLAPQDEIDNIKMTPWIGFVYTYPEYRGHRYAGLLIDKAKQLAVEKGYKEIYVSSEEIGLYEKYGFDKIGEEMSIHGYITGIYKAKI